MTKMTLVRSVTTMEDHQRESSPRPARPVELAVYAAAAGVLLVGVTYLVGGLTGRRTGLGALLQVVVGLVFITTASIFADTTIERCRRDLVDLIYRLRR